MISETVVIENSPASAGWDSAQSEQLIQELSGLRDDMLELEAAAGSLLGLSAAHRESAKNLVHYMALRRHDIRQLQETLATLGLSSLGRAESHVKCNIETILGVLHRLAGQAEPSPDMRRPAIGLVESNALLEVHTEALLGPKPAHRNVRIMVTMPSEAAHDYELVHDLLDRGMNCMRINCAHDDTKAWSSMIANLRRAERRTGKQCRVLMDLAGPKLRTGHVEPGARVIKLRPARDHFGRVKKPARIWLHPIGSASPPPPEADACVPVPGEWLESLGRGDLIRFFDTRGAARQMRVVGERSGARWAESFQTAYVAPGTVLHAYPAGEHGSECTTGRECQVGELPASEQWIGLKNGDRLILTRSLLPGKPAQYDASGRLLSPARIGVTLPGIFDDVRAGERVLLDDGRIGGLITSVSQDEIHVEITQARPRGEKLRADKGVNLPDSNLQLPALTDKDIEDLAFVAKHADLVGYSFVRSAADVRALQTRLSELGGDRLGIILKIETEKAFEQLPNLMLAAMHSPCAGVMIARGDLAVECGYERLAEVQEEILWSCEAAHMPVIWATQVLESLAKDGIPSRAEITDAAMGERAECVMLNKGPYVLQALDALDNILRRMEGHQSKKRSMLRHLKLADQFSFGE
jgi:pyruvate kinase